MAVAVASPAAAQTIVTSAAPDDVDVTVYRAPNRPADTALDLDWLEGYALISERRTVTIPAGESDIRFEGVAGGMLPQSAIVTGLPDGIVERNRDALLLSPATLLDRSLGRRVHLRRTSLATGAVREHDAIVRSSADGAVVLQTQDGFEALRCTGLPETPIYDSVPQGLSARPTLSVRTRAAQPVTATMTLSYLADGFDWQADYVAQLSEDGTSIDLFAWLTLASMDETSFPNADTQAVAGRLNRRNSQRSAPEGEGLELECWPAATTSDIPLEQWQRQQMRRGRLGAARFDDGEAIVVTGSRMQSLDLASSAPITVVSTAELEDLGDLKLYRIPEPVTVAANSQKQVALLQRPGVRANFVYRRAFEPGRAVPVSASYRYLVARNRESEGLGIPLPAGRLSLFAAGPDRSMLIGQGTVEDRAVGEEVEIALGVAPGVMSRVEPGRASGRRQTYRLIVTNDQPSPIRFEADFVVGTSMTFLPDTRLSRRDGRPLWEVDVPANGSATLSYDVVRRRR